MGADFLFAECDVESVDDLPERVKLLGKALATYDVDGLLGIVTDIGGCDIEDRLDEFVYGESGVDRGEPPPAEEVVKFMVELFSSSVEDLFDGYRRDVAIVGGPGNKGRMVTGGMSWGDPPSDAYDVVILVAIFQDVIDVYLRNETEKASAAGPAVTGDVGHGIASSVLVPDKMIDLEIGRETCPHCGRPM